MSFDPEKITLFGKTDARGQHVSFGIKAKDRQRHMYIVGKTGMGKSTLLENMAVQDIQNGEGVAFIDPHGSTAEALLDYVPEHRVNDVIYFAPFDLDNPISFNVMEDVGPDKRHLVVSGLMSTFKKIWVDAWSARMEYILTNALLALLEYPDTTLLSVNRLFSDKHFRERVVAYIKDPAVKSFWVDEFANYTERFAAEALPAIQNKIGQFTGNPLIRNIIGQPHSSFDIRKIMDEKKILIMNLSKGLVGESNANLLGSMLTTRIYLAAMSRADLPVEQMKRMPNFYFYVDEFQSFANATFANILSEARKYHLNLIIAHQYIAQMEEEVRDAVFGNVGTTITFRVGPFDAELLEPIFTPRFMATDLVNLGFAQIYLTLMIDGVGSQPFSAITLPPISRPQVSCRDMVIAASRRNFTNPRSKVEEIVSALNAPAEPLPKSDKPKPTPDQNGNNGTPVSHSNVANRGGNGGGGSGRRDEGSNANRSNQDRVASTQARPSVSRETDKASQGSNQGSVQNGDMKPRVKMVEQSEAPERETFATPPSRSESSAPKKPVPSNNQPSNKRSIEDLRAVLARLAKDSPADDTKKEKPVEAKVQKIEPAPKSAVGPSLKDLVAKVVSVPPTTSVSEDYTGRVTEDKISSKTATLPIQNISKAETVTPTDSVFEAPKVDAKTRQEVEAMAAEAEAVFASLEKNSSVKPLPDLKKIEKILRGGKERSPFR